MKLNRDKYHFLLSDHKHQVMFAKRGHSKIWENCTHCHCTLCRIYIDHAGYID